MIKSSADEESDFNDTFRVISSQKQSGRAIVKITQIYQQLMEMDASGLQLSL